MVKKKQPKTFIISDNLEQYLGYVRKEKLDPERVHMCESRLEAEIAVRSNFKSGIAQTDLEIVDIREAR